MRSPLRVHVVAFATFACALASCASTATTELLEASEAGRLASRQLAVVEGDAMMHEAHGVELTIPPGWSLQPVGRDAQEATVASLMYDAEPFCTVNVSLVRLNAFLGLFLSRDMVGEVFGDAMEQSLPGARRVRHQEILNLPNGKRVQRSTYIGTTVAEGREVEIAAVVVTTKAGGDHVSFVGMTSTAYANSLEEHILQMAETIR